MADFALRLPPKAAVLLANPASLVAIGIAFVSPEPVATWLGGAAFNLGWLVVYLLSTVLLWNGASSRTAQPESAATDQSV